MSDLETRIKIQISNLEKERDTFAMQAQAQMAFYANSIKLLQGLLEPEQQDKPNEQLPPGN